MLEPTDACVKNQRCWPIASSVLWVSAATPSIAVWSMISA